MPVRAQPLHARATCRRCRSAGAQGRRVAVTINSTNRNHCEFKAPPTMAQWMKAQGGAPGVLAGRRRERGRAHLRRQDHAGDVRDRSRRARSSTPARSTTAARRGHDPLDGAQLRAGRADAGQGRAGRREGVDDAVRLLAQVLIALTPTRQRDALGAPDALVQIRMRAQVAKDRIAHVRGALGPPRNGAERR